jgi:hypothetical protein
MSLNEQKLLPFSDKESPSKFHKIIEPRKDLLLLLDHYQYIADSFPILANFLKDFY